MSENNIIFNTGGVKFPSLIIPTGSQPLDSRTIVQNLPTRADEFTDGAVYIGMTVSCLNDKNFYMLEKIENGNLSWKQVGKKTDLSNYDTSSQVSNKISTAINDLDVTDNAVAGKYVSAVSETDGKITVTRATLPTLSSLGGITPSDVDTKISTVIDGLDVTDTAVATKYVSSVSQTDGKITVTRANLPTLSSLGGITPSDVDTKISTALDGLDVTDTAVATKYVSAVSETNGKITVTRADLPTLSSLGGITPSDVDTKILTAINDLDVTDTAVATKYVSAVSETDGKITVTRADLPTLSSLGGITPSDVDTKISTTISGLDATVTGNNITVFTYNGKVASNYISTPQIVETDGKLTSFTVLAPGTNLVTKEYVDHMHQVLLGDNNLKDTVDTITEISYWLDKNPNDAVNLTLSLVELTEKVNDNEKIVATAINNINDMFNSYATIAYVNDKTVNAYTRSVNYTNTYVSSRLSWDVI